MSEMRTSIATQGSGRNGGEMADAVVTMFCSALRGQGHQRAATVRPDVDAADVAPDAHDDHGEQLHVCERVVISPCAGVFEPTPAAVAAGARIEVGTIVGRVSRRDVPSLFAGRLMAMLALPGERVRTNQPVAWLRTD